MKKIFTLFIALIACIGTIFASVQIGSLYYNLDAFTLTADVTFMPNGNYSGYIIIPDKVTHNSVTYNVTGIGDYAFNGCSKLTGVTIPLSVTSIGDSAFYSCSDLTSIEISNSVTSIGDSAFIACESLTSVTLNSSTIAGKTYSSDFNFKNIFGPQVKEYVIGNDVTALGSHACLGCSSLINVTIGDNVKRIGIYAFVGCSALKSVTLGSSITNIGDFAFNGCSVLQSVTIPDNVTRIGNSAFDGCSAMKSVTLGKSVASIGEGAFYYCQSLTSVVIPNSVTDIGGFTFAYCTGLKSVTMSDSITSIRRCLFRACETLTSVIIPERVTSIGENAFSNCYALSSVNIPDSVTSIGKGAFYGCTSLESVTIPNSVTSIEQEAFYCCPAVTNITVEEGNSVYDSRDKCNAIIETATNTLIAGCQNTTIPGSVTSIGKGAFYCSMSMKSVIIPNSVTEIGDYAFYNCYALESATIGQSVTSIGNYAFYDCRLKNLSIPKSVTSIGDWAFRYCSRLTNIICEAVTHPSCGGSNVFANVSKSTPLYVPANSVNDYKSAYVWKEFTNIQAIIQAEESEVVKPEAVPTDSSVVITWPIIDDAVMYAIEIKTDVEQILTLSFNETGQLVGISYAPARDGRVDQSAATTQTATGWQYTVNGLKPNTTYTYTVTATKKDGLVAYENIMTFITSSPQGIEDIEAITPSTKMLKDGRVYIQRGEKVYTIQGQEVK